MKNISFILELRPFYVHTNKESFVRIVDNILSNACKYNIVDGSVTLILSQTSLKIIDTGKGIKNPERIFDRFYKEHERGIGIGLHIVKKLCDSLRLSISVTSRVSQGSTFTLDFKEITVN